MSIHAIVLAAGLSRRMGFPNKLLLPINGEPVLRLQVQRLLNSNINDLTVILGHESESVAAVLADLPVRLMRNPDYPKGRMSTVHYGLQQAPNSATGVLLCLADQPLLLADDVNVLLRVFEQHSDKILVPEYQGQRGNPVLVSMQYRTAILAHQEQGGCRGFIDQHPQYVQQVPMPNAHILLDIDTPQDYAKLKMTSAFLGKRDS